VKAVPWSVVAVVGIVVGGLVALTIADKDTAALGGIALLILAGLGFTVAQNNETRTNVNGNMSRLVLLTERMADRAVDAAAAAPAQPPPYRPLEVAPPPYEDRAA